jgi:hypothetical protein
VLHLLAHGWDIDFVFGRGLNGLDLVPGGGIEPPRAEARRILSPLRLPVPPSRLGSLAFAAFELAEDIQTNPGPTALQP